jgi:hypothetical protein
MSYYRRLIEQGLIAKLLAVYKMSDATDSLGLYSGTARTGNTFTTANAVDGLACQFLNSSNSGIVIPDNDAFSFTDTFADKPFALKFNLNASDITPTLSPIFARYSGSNNSTSEYLIYLRSGKVAVLLFNKTGSIFIGAETVATIPSNTARNIIVSYNGSGSWTGITIEINGVAQTPLTNLSSAGTYVCMGNTAQSTMIGSYTNSVTSNYAGTIDELYVFNALLTADEKALLQTNFYPNI